MNKLKLTFLFFLFITISATAQQQVEPGNGGMGAAVAQKLNSANMIFFGGGVNSPSTSTRPTGLVSGVDLNVSYFKPLWFWKDKRVELGLNGELGYTMGNGSYDVKNQYTVYQLEGQIKEPLITENSSSIKNTSFRGGAGFQMNIHFGNFIVSPIINAGYLSTTQKAYSIDETIYSQVNSSKYRLLDQKETKTSGLGVFPKLRFTFMLSPRIGVWLEGNYTIGPKINTETTRFVIDSTIPIGNINEGNFQEGQYITTKNETSFSSVGVNGGVLFSLVKKGGGKGGKGSETVIFLGGKMRLTEDSSVENKPTSEEYKVIGLDEVPELCTNYHDINGEILTFNDGFIRLEKVYFINFSPCNEELSSSNPSTSQNKSDLIDFKRDLRINNNLLIATKTIDLKGMTLEKLKAKSVQIQKGEYQIISKGKSKTTDVKINAVTTDGRKHEYIGHITLLR